MSIQELTSQARLHLEDWLNFSCSHRLTSFPVAVRTAGLPDDQAAPPAQAYVLCLSCGRRLAYDGPQSATVWWGSRSKCLSLAPHTHRCAK